MTLTMSELDRMETELLNGCGPSYLDTLQLIYTARRSIAPWQPVETAPKDGTLILVHRPKAKCYPVVDTDYWSPKIEGGAWMRSPFDEQPSHWMPLPVVPEGEPTPGIKSEPSGHGGNNGLEPRQFVMVPREPTLEMIDKGLSVTSAFLDIPGSALTVNREKMRRRYCAMLSVAPPPSEERKEDDTTRGNRDFAPDSDGNRGNDTGGDDRFRRPGRRPQGSRANPDGCVGGSSDSSGVAPPPLESGEWPTSDDGKCPYSDIADLCERLQQEAQSWPKGGFYSALFGEAAAMLEAQRVDIEAAHNTIKAFTASATAELSEKEREIERVDKKKQWFKTCYETVALELAEKELEIERLKDENRTLGSWIDSRDEQLGELTTQLTAYRAALEEMVEFGAKVPGWHSGILDRARSVLKGDRT